ncbi:putative trans-zeatin O-beta-D-glucosyltransferase [Helianthus annuus]|uniref:Glycosyltransferase n=1 Tax=Helianthus annuus TaxID=4232 RepID=A0A251VN43_HELAN|nr:zeatin O-xylosyltransferase [Helianthus annuus]KAF5821331.1 putative trans-zeatin O-beta-D-glucosyltransferase [Helianthus annuus]KAJ0611015.1 putative trans-zeatin O-beta-D-glucosyltransferase [Helianthus annuus]KAJ0626283.1 putative trans-zeatin O-beta-D-glucosyltransferase [Helianthus annuus]KAJ0807770.1 putative trans-zeatin O-beta-D-glucosyltransferase [Helianthus annuus]
MENLDVVVVVVPFVAQGHLNQLLHLSRLLSAYNLPVHIAGTTTHNRQAKLRIHGWNHNSDTNIHFHEFETPQFESPPPNPTSSTKFPSHLIPSFKASSHLREPFAKLLANISNTARRVVVIHDFLMSTVVQDVVSYPNVEAYVFHCASAFTTFSYMWEEKGRPCLEDDNESYMHLSKLANIQDLVPPEFFEFIYTHVGCEKFNSGNIHDTSKVFDSKFIDYISREGLSGNTKQWAIGPFNPVSINNNDDKDSGKRHKSLIWLDKQVQDSVIYVAFGSTTSLSDEQIQELAIGLEKSGQKFIWVLRDADKGDIFKGEGRNIELPKGFEERVEGQGLVVREWAPQLEILAHMATGGFMSHCGWNSSMEGITMGVPIAAWPMHSDQPRNAMLITDVLKIGVNVGDWGRDGEVVTSLVIEKAIRILMDSDEGKEIRKRANKLGEDVKQSLEEGGVTRMEINAFVDHITRQ